MTQVERGFVLLALLIVATTGQANLVVNGSFEDPVAVSDRFIPSGDTALIGWNILSGSVDLIPNTGSWPAFEGGQSLDLNGQSAGTIEQAFATTAGWSYELSFFYANNPGGVGQASVSVVGFGASPLLSESFIHDSSTQANMDWTSYSATFTADSGLTTLQFTSLNSPQSFSGLALDHVTVQVVPEPSTAGLLGVGLTVTALFRRRTLFHSAP